MCLFRPLLFLIQLQWLASILAIRSILSLKYDARLYHLHAMPYPLRDLTPIPSLSRTQTEAAYLAIIDSAHYVLRIHSLRKSMGSGRLIPHHLLVEHHVQLATQSDDRLRSFLMPMNRHNRTGQQCAKRTLPSICLLYTSPSPRDRQKSRMPSSA